MLPESGVSPSLLYLWLSDRPGVSIQLANRLIERLGSPEAVYTADQQQLAAVGHLKPNQLDALADKSLDAVRQIIRRCKQKQIQIITRGGSRYPQCLRTIDNPPLALYVRGTWPDFDRVPAITVIGTRNASAYGLSISEQLGHLLGKAGFTVLSGMALGNDGAAHRGALRAGGRTAAVLADSPDICFPPQHTALMQDILASGAIISEIPPGNFSHKPSYQMRNRILSGLAIAVVVVEASARRSGTTITAHHAANQGRDVYAVPGAIDAPASAGCNELIASGDAMILTRLDSLLTYYQSALPTQPLDSSSPPSSLPLPPSTPSLSQPSRPAQPAPPMDPPAQSQPSRQVQPASPMGPPSQRQPSRSTQPAPPMGPPVQPQPPRQAQPAPPMGSPSSPQPPQQPRPAWQPRPTRPVQRQSQAPQRETVPPAPELTTDEQQIVELIRQGITTPNEIMERGELPTPQLMGILTVLEMKGVIVMRGGRFVYMPS